MPLRPLSAADLELVVGPLASRAITAARRRHPLLAARAAPADKGEMALGGGLMTGGTPPVAAGRVLGLIAAAAEAAAAFALGALAGGPDAAGGLSARAPGAGCTKGAGLGGKADTEPPGGGVGSGKIGTVDTARGLALTGAGTLTGCSSRDTSRSPERATSTTFSPRAANRRANASPMPLDAPVMSVVFIKAEARSPQARREKATNPLSVFLFF